jgi:phosphomevalonate kinase
MNPNDYAASKAANDAKKHMEDIKDELSLLLFNEQTLIREIELLRPKIESKIVVPKKTTDLRNMKQDDLYVDVVPANMADMETITARKAFYYANLELAQTRVGVEAKKELFNSYKEHIQQGLANQAKPCTDEMIYEAFNNVKKLKSLTKEEGETFNNISNNLLKILNQGKERRMELYETLQNIIRQHKS